MEVEENTFNRLLIQMKRGLAARQKPKQTEAIQYRIDTFYVRYANDDVTANELLERLSFVVVKTIKARKNNRVH